MISRTINNRKHSIKEWVVDAKKKISFFILKVQVLNQ